MSKQLTVYLHQHAVGTLTQDEAGKLRFRYLAAWVESPNATPISQSLPLQHQSFNQKQCRGYFAGILPEETMRKIIAKNLHVSAQNDFSLLEKLGGECAGALTFLTPDVEYKENAYAYQVLNQEALIATLEKLAKSPLLAGIDDIRLSLAGAQEKLSLNYLDDTFALPLHGSPSSHILKPHNLRFPGLVENEAYCLRLAKNVGLNTASASVHTAGAHKFLLVERYDREIIDGNIKRIHQEDICQALAVPSEMKYQNEGGPSLKACFDLIRTISDAPVLDLQQLLKAVIFNFIIGNHDAHGKNFSIIYRNDRNRQRTRLAPFYDLISTVYYPELSGKMAMKIGGEYQAAKVRPKHFEKLAAEIGFSAKMVKQSVVQMAADIFRQTESSENNNPVANQLAELFSERCKSIISLFDD